MSRTTPRSKAALARVNMLEAIEEAIESQTRYHVYMSMRMRMGFAALLVVGASSVAAADSFGGFSSIDRPYLVNQDKVCTPLKVTGGKASGSPSCAKATTDEVAKLSIKLPGTSSVFTATSSGRTLTVTKKGSGTAVAWNASDSIGAVVEVFPSQYDDRVAVTYTIRRAGREVTEVIAFDLLGTNPTTTTPTPGDPPPTTTPTPTADPKVEKALVTARKSAKGKAVAAWTAVLALDAEHSEGLYGLAAAQVRTKANADALATLAKLAASTRTDAVEWVIEARFDAVFSPLRSNEEYRKLVGYDRKATTVYERLMGLGGQWEQTGTSCDKPEVRFNALRNRSFKLRVKTRCEGQVYDSPFKGTWRIEGTRIVLTLPTKGKATSAEDEAACEMVTIGDEDAMNCRLDRDIEFTVLPTRR